MKTMVKKLKLKLFTIATTLSVTNFLLKYIRVIVTAARLTNSSVILIIETAIFLLATRTRYYRKSDTPMTTSLDTASMP